MKEVKEGRFALNKDLELLGLLPVMLDERPVIVRQALSTLRENIKKNSKTWCSTLYQG